MAPPPSKPWPSTRSNTWERYQWSSACTPQRRLAPAEGGAVVCTDRNVLEAVRAALNFGFMGRRECTTAGTNGKMSEYHAAVGEVGQEMDHWPAKKAAFYRVARSYAQAATTRGIVDRIVNAPDVASCYALFNGRDGAETDAVEAALTEAGIDTRRWYGHGLQHEPYYRNIARDALPIAEALGNRLLGLPMAIDISPTDVERVVDTIARSLAPQGTENG